MGGVIDSFFVSLGYKLDPKGLGEFQKKAESAKDSILSVGNALKVFATGFVAKGIAKIGSEFEQNSIAIAGFLQALKLSPDFETGLTDAAAVIQQITLDAAKLPGEAEEYIEVFRAGLPTLKAALPGGSIAEMTKFTNTITALGKTLNIDAPQIGRDLKLMLGAQGRAGGHVRTFQELLSFMRLIPGQAKLDSAAFNAMSQSQRAALLQQTFGIEGLQKMLQASAGSFDAMAGAAISMVKQVTRAITGPLFNAMKQGLEAINAVVFDAKGQLTEFGQGLVDGGRRVISFAVNLVKAAGSIVVAIAKIPGLLTVLRFALRPVLALLAGMAIQKGIGWVIKLGRAMNALKVATMGPVVLLGALGIALALVAEDVYGFFNGIDSVTGVLVEKWGPAIYVVIAALGALGIALGAVVIAQNATAISMAVGWAVAAAPLVFLLAGMALLVKAITDVTKHWEVFKQSMKLRSFQVGNFLSGGALGHLADAVTGGDNGSFEGGLRAELGKRIETEDQQRAFDAMGPKQDGYDANKGALGPFQDPSQYKTPQLLWQKFEPPPPAGASTSTNITNITNVNGARIDVKGTSDAVKTGQEAARELVRQGQSKKAY